jgi:DNA-binding MarR family transcriptional regulator
MAQKYIVHLSSEEREGLLSITKKGRHSVHKITHAKILLATDCSGENLVKKPDPEIASDLGINISTVERVRKRCVEEGIDAALERKPRTQKKSLIIQGEEEAHLIAPDFRTFLNSNALEGRI